MVESGIKQQNVVKDAIAFAFFIGNIRNFAYRTRNYFKTPLESGPIYLQLANFINAITKNPLGFGIWSSINETPLNKIKSLVKFKDNRKLQDLTIDIETFFASSDYSDAKNAYHAIATKYYDLYKTEGDNVPLIIQDLSSEKEFQDMIDKSSEINRTTFILVYEMKTDHFNWNFKDLIKEIIDSQWVYDYCHEISYIYLYVAAALTAVFTKIEHDWHFNNLSSIFRYLNKLNYLNNPIGNAYELCKYRIKDNKFYVIDDIGFTPIIAFFNISPRLNRNPIYLSSMVDLRNLGSIKVLTPGETDFYGNLQDTINTIAAQPQNDYESINNMINGIMHTVFQNYPRIREVIFNFLQGPFKIKEDNTLQYTAAKIPMIEWLTKWYTDQPLNENDWDLKRLMSLKNILEANKNLKEELGKLLDVYATYYCINLLPVLCYYYLKRSNRNSSANTVYSTFSDDNIYTEKLSEILRGINNVANRTTDDNGVMEDILMGYSPIFDFQNNVFNILSKSGAYEPKIPNFQKLTIQQLFEVVENKYQSVNCLSQAESSTRDINNVPIKDLLKAIQYASIPTFTIRSFTVETFKKLVLDDAELLNAILPPPKGVNPIQDLIKQAQTAPPQQQTPAPAPQTPSAPEEMEEVVQTPAPNQGDLQAAQAAQAQQAAQAAQATTMQQQPQPMDVVFTTSGDHDTAARNRTHTDVVDSDRKPINAFKQDATINNRRTKVLPRERPPEQLVTAMLGTACTGPNRAEGCYQIPNKTNRQCTNAAMAVRGLCNFKSINVPFENPVGNSRDFEVYEGLDVGSQIKLQLQRALIRYGYAAATLPVYFDKALDRHFYVMANPSDLNGDMFLPLENLAVDLARSPFILGTEESVNSRVVSSDTAEHFARLSQLFQSMFTRARRIPEESNQQYLQRNINPHYSRILPRPSPPGSQTVPVEIINSIDGLSDQEKQDIREKRNTFYLSPDKLYYVPFPIFYLQPPDNLLRGNRAYINSKYFDASNGDRKRKIMISRGRAMLLRAMQHFRNAFILYVLACTNPINERVSPADVERVINGRMPDLEVDGVPKGAMAFLTEADKNALKSLLYVIKSISPGQTDEAKLQFMLQQTKSTEMDTTGVARRAKPTNITDAQTIDQKVICFLEVLWSYWFDNNAIGKLRKRMRFRAKLANPADAVAETKQEMSTIRNAAQSMGFSARILTAMGWNDASLRGVVIAHISALRSPAADVI